MRPRALLAVGLGSLLLFAGVAVGTVASALVVLDPCLSTPCRDPWGELAVGGWLLAVVGFVTGVNGLLFRRLG